MKTKLLILLALCGMAYGQNTYVKACRKAVNMAVDSAVLPVSLWTNSVLWVTPESPVGNVGATNAFWTCYAKNCTTNFTQAILANQPIRTNSGTGLSFYFDGNDALDTGVSSIGGVDLFAEAGKSWAFATWIKVPSNSMSVVIGKSATSTTAERTFQISFNRPGNATHTPLILNRGSFIGTGFNLDDGTWHHLAAVCSGTNVYFYVDGTFRTNAIVGAATNNNGTISIGRAFAGDTPTGTGNMADIQLFSTFTTNQVAELYNLRKLQTISYGVDIAAAGQTNTLTLGGSSNLIIDWGDASKTVSTGTASVVTHVYSATGTYTVVISDARHITRFDMFDNKVTLNSADVKNMVNVSRFAVSGIKAGTFNSSDVSAWRPATFYLYTMPSGYAGTLNSVDISSWRPAYFRIQSMPEGYAGTFDSADISAWSPTFFQLSSMPTSFTANLSGNDFSSMTKLTTFNISNIRLDQQTVDSTLWGLYQASTNRSGVNGTINVAGTDGTLSNAAPSGLYQNASVCPVTNGTPGGEIAYELQYDDCGALSNHWATVNIN